MSNFVIARAGAGKIGAVGAAEAACTDIGSIKSVKLSVETEVTNATASNALDMIVETAYGASNVTVTLELEELTAANVQRVLNLDANNAFSGDVATPTYFSGYFHGFKIGGAAKTLHIVRAMAKPGSELSLGAGDQQVLTLECLCMVYPESTFGYKVFKFLDDTADTTAPTITGVVPANAATGVAKAVSTVITWTFSEAIRLEDVRDENFFAIPAAGGSPIAGALSLGTNNTVVTFTPTSAWGATTTYLACARHGVRDVAGNGLVADSFTTFTTGA